MKIAIIKGNMANNPELKTTNSGKHVTTFCIAAQDYGEDNPSWIDCVAWEKTAENICNLFCKGKQILVEGIIKTRTYEDSSGKKQKVTEVVVNRFEFCGKKDGETTTVNEAVNQEAPKQVEEFDYPF